MEIDLDKIKKVHIIGIGGIGVSAIARLMQSQGKTVSGSDTSSSLITEELSKLGISIFVGHDGKNIDSDIDLLVHTIAISLDNPELVEATKKNIAMRTYPQMLTILSKDMYTIAISGTHGKTTTTAMLAKVFVDYDLDPTVIVGSLMKDYDSNLKVGNSNYLIVEACEYRRSFLNLYPTILAITNIDTDHLDYYKDLEDIQSAFRELALRIPKHGAIICNTNNPKIRPIIHNLQCNIIDYSQFLNMDNDDLALKTPGIHNKENASVAYAISDFLNIDKINIIKSLNSFNGTWRRFEYHGTTKNSTLLYDDYAHHPTEIKATLQGFKDMYHDKKRVVFFQPHLYSRTKLLIDDFKDVFYDADEVYILPIYGAREIFDDSINSGMLVESITHNNVSCLNTLENAREKIKQLDHNVVVITMGAGDIYKILQ